MSGDAEMTGDLRIRDAGIEDWAETRDLLLASFEATARQMPPEIGDPYLVEVADVDSRSQTGELIVAELDGRIVGTVTNLMDSTSDTHPWPANGSVIRLLGVLPSARGRGVGRALAEECLARARTRDRQFVGLHTAPFMTAAVALYVSMGFTRAPQWDFDAHRYFAADGTDTSIRGTAYLHHLAG